MPIQVKNIIRINETDLEWLYVPDIEYGKCDGIVRKIQMIIPYKRKWDRNEKFPLILFIPGSAWHRQEMYNNIPSRAAIAKRGYAIAEIQYRESELAVFPAQVFDVKKAIRFIYSIAEKFHIDTNNMFLAGDSSGGHIALLTGLTASYGDFDADFGSENSCNVNGIISFSAPTDMFLSDGNGPMEELLGAKRIEDVPDLARSCSCGTYISEDRDIPPILMFHGTEDSVVTIEHSRNLFSQLKKCDKEIEYYEVEREGHASASFWGDEILEITLRFLEKNRK